MSEVTHQAKPAEKSAATRQVQGAGPVATSGLDWGPMAEDRKITPDQVRYLQRHVGNQAVARLLNRQPPVVQPKLMVGPVGDRYEQEADRIAAQVVNSPAPIQRHDEEEQPGMGVQRAPLAAQITRLVQRHHTGEEEELQRAPLISVLQRHHAIRNNEPPEGQELETEEEELMGVQRSPLPAATLPTLQRHHAIRNNQPPEGQELEEEEEELMGVQRAPLPTVQRHYPHGRAHPNSIGKSPTEREEQRKVQRKGDGLGSFDPGNDFTRRLNANRGRGRPLGDGIRRSMESSFGADFSQVRVHTGAEAAQMSRDIQAQAFTHGSDIYFNQSKFNPGDQGGRKLLAHELTHVVQQTGAGVRRAPEARIQRKWRTPRQWWTDRKAKKQAELDTVDYDNLQGLKRGQILPDVGKMAERRMQDMLKYDKVVIDEESTHRQIRDAVTLIDDDFFMQGVIDAVNVANANDEATPKAATSHLDAVRAAFRTGITGHETENVPVVNYLIAMIKAIPKGDDYKPKTRILNEFLTQVQQYSKRMAATSAPGLRPEHKYDNLPGMSITETFNEERKNVKFQQVTVSPEDAPRWAAALKQMDAVKALLDPDTAPPVNQEVGWRGGGKLGDKYTWVKDMRKKKVYGPLATYLDNKHAKSTKIYARFAEVDALMRRIVEPEMLGRVPVPTFKISTRGAQSYTNPWGLRASAARGEVNIAYDEDMPTIAHEVGHIIEEYLPMDDWADIHMLLSERHKAAGGGDRAAKGESIFTRDEGRYKGKYVTSKYTSRGYTKDNAEVLSMWMQFMATPDKALQLINGDPQHAALILRMMRPDDYAKTAALRPFDIYLPNPTGEEGPLARYKKAQEKTQKLFKM